MARPDLGTFLSVDNNYGREGIFYGDNGFNTVIEPEQTDISPNYGEGDFILKTCGENVESTVSGVVKRVIKNSAQNSGSVEIMTKNGLITYTNLINILVTEGDGVFKNELLGEAGKSGLADNVCLVKVFEK